MILASKSPRRRELMEEAGFDFTCCTSDFDESSVHARDPHELPHALAWHKALSVSPNARPGELVIGSDTVVILGERVLGKPADADEARQMLRDLSGKTHEVTTGVSVLCDGCEVLGFSETARVTFWDLDDDEIDAYVACGEPMDKAGAYGIQGKGRLLVRGIEGDFYTVMGLPISRLYRELRGLEA